MLNGAKRCLLALWQKDTTAAPSDEYGDRQMVNALLPVATMWGSLKPVTGAELYMDAQRQATTRYIFETGWFEGQKADAAMVFTYRGRSFDIVAILPDEDKRKSVRFYLDEKPTGA